jgi:SAM-dependent methyltransferase
MSFDPEAVRAFERDGWNRAATTYETSFATATTQFVPALLAAGGVRTGRAVLDVACGPGIVTAAAAATGARVTGVDFSEPMLAVARERHPALQFRYADAESLPLADAGYDAVVSNFGIHHVPRPALALREAHRVLRPGGALAFTIWAAPTDNLAWKLVFDAIAECGDPAASQAPTPGGGFSSAAHCLDALGQAGFADTVTRPLQGTWRHADAAGLLAALQAGTARMAALIGAQDPAVLPAILAHIDAAAAPWRDDAGIGVPIAAIVAAGVKR